MSSERPRPVAAPEARAVANESSHAHQVPASQAVSGATHDRERRWEPRRAGRSAGDWAKTSYYGVPVIHKPHWHWLIITYFFLGGIAGGSYVIASIADLVGGTEGRRIT